MESKPYLAANGNRALTNSWRLVRINKDSTETCWNIKEAKEENARLVDFVNTPHFVAITTPTAMYAYDKHRDKRHTFRYPNARIYYVKPPYADPNDRFTIIAINNIILCLNDIADINSTHAFHLEADAKPIASIEDGESYCDERARVKLVKVRITFTDEEEKEIACRIPYSDRCGKGLRFLEQKWSNS